LGDKPSITFYIILKGNQPEVGQSLVVARPYTDFEDNLMSNYKFQVLPV